MAALTAVYIVTANLKNRECVNYIPSILLLIFTLVTIIISSSIFLDSYVNSLLLTRVTYNIIDKSSLLSSVRKYQAWHGPSQ